MKKFRNILLAGLAGLSLLIAACAGGPSEEQLQKLIETRRAAEAAEEQCQELQQQKQDLQAELEQKQQELARAKAERARVERTVSEGGQ